MFEKKDLSGQGIALAPEIDREAMTQTVPQQDARVLASYLLSLKRDSALPESMDHAPKAKEEDAN